MSVHRHHPILAYRRDPARWWALVALACAVYLIWLVVTL